MKEKTNVREALVLVPLMILFASFIGVTLCSMIYMAKDNNYDNMINQYFNISKELYGKLIYLHVSKELLVNGMNLCSLAFLFGNFMLVWQISSAREKKRRRGLLIAGGVYLLLQAVAYNTVLQQSLYFGKMGFLPDSRIFRKIYGGFHHVTVIGNFLMLIIGCGFIFLSDLRKKQVPELLRVKRAIFLTQISLVGLYFYMFFSLPDSFLWMSRSTGYISYHSLKMAPYMNGMRAVIWLILLFLIILFYNMYRYQLMRERVSQEEYVFSSIIASSEISTRAFSHYVKNELLGIMAEVEALSAKEEEPVRELENIRKSCQEVYDRLNTLQKNSNRIVLNQSRQNLAEVIQSAVEENRAMLEKTDCRILYEKSQKKVEVFLDSGYMKEVFRNIFCNAMEAMRESHGEKRVFVELKVYDEEAEIAIKDTGPGLSESIINRLFDPFVSTKSTKLNWGIGLSFCKRIINSHRGRITAENGELGAEFHIYLPLIGEVPDGK